MSFTRKSADLTPIVDTVFSIVALAKKDKAENGDDKVVDATIGSLYGEDGKLVAFDSVFDHYDAIDHRVKAAYAASFSGNPDYRETVYSWATQSQKLSLNHSVIATPGGSGADSMAITTFLDEGETLIIPDIAWGSYTLMAHENNINYVQYSMFDGNHFNLDSFKKTVTSVAEKQDRVAIIINDPCHNPSGYSLSNEEWKDLVSFLNEVGKKNHVVLIDDIAYIDYSFNLEHSRDYMQNFNDISDKVMIIVAFSCSKTLTSYGLRCGAAIILAKNSSDVRDAEIIMEKKARATWSSIPNAAMVNFVWTVTKNHDVFTAEKQKYIDLMKERSSIFLKEAGECGLQTYPFKEGFFVTLKVEDNKVRNRIHQSFMDEHIYTVCVNKGIRIAICSLPVKKVYGLAQKMKNIEDKNL